MMDRFRFSKRPEYRVGWIASGIYSMKMYGLLGFEYIKQKNPAVYMRSGGLIDWMRRYDPRISYELYRPDQRYNLVVFQKSMDVKWQNELLRIRRYGGKTVFDANVNYYETWGDYVVEDTKPTKQQQQDAIWMTTHADWVVADSTYIRDIIRKFTDSVTWIPDNVNFKIYRGMRRHHFRKDLVLIWSGVGKKSEHLLLIYDVFARVKNVKLVLVSDEPPLVLEKIQKVVPCKFVYFSDRSYNRELIRSDVIISPKMLINAYEMGHTEYKITLGMACGLPAVASPQQSYIEAIEDAGGGFVAHDLDQWLESLHCLIEDPKMRAYKGMQARKTVLSRYSTPVVAQQFLSVIQQTLGIGPF